VRQAILKGKTLHTPYGKFRCPSGIRGAQEGGHASVFSGSTPRGCIRKQGNRFYADIWDNNGTWLLETFEVKIPPVSVRLQEKSHPLPKGGETTQYTITIPKNLVDTLGWKKGDRIHVTSVADTVVKMVKVEGS